jgi:hypothetical protein
MLEFSSISRDGNAPGDSWPKVEEMVPPKSGCCSINTALGGGGASVGVADGWGELLMAEIAELELSLLRTAVGTEMPGGSAEEVAETEAENSGNG